MKRDTSRSAKTTVAPPVYKAHVGLCSASSKLDTITVHAPHPPSPQPNLVPVNPSSARRQRLNRRSETHTATQLWIPARQQQAEAQRWGAVCSPLRKCKRVVSAFPDGRTCRFPFTYTMGSDDIGRSVHGGRRQACSGRENASTTVTHTFSTKRRHGETSGSRMVIL